MRANLLLSGLVLLQASLIESQWTPASLPNPQTEPGRCGRSHVPRSWVCDPDGMLSKRSGDVIEGILKDIASGEAPYTQAGACGGRRLNAGYQVWHLHHGSAGTMPLPIGTIQAKVYPGTARDLQSAALSTSWTQLLPVSRQLPADSHASDGVEWAGSRCHHAATCVTVLSSSALGPTPCSIV